MCPRHKNEDLKRLKPGKDILRTRRSVGPGMRGTIVKMSRTTPESYATNLQNYFHSVKMAINALPISQVAKEEAIAILEKHVTSAVLSLNHYARQEGTDGFPHIQSK